MMTATIMGIPMGVMLMWAVGVTYTIGLFVLLKEHKSDHSELMKAFLTFMASMAGANIFLGLTMYDMRPIYMFLAMIAIFTGSVFMLKFPLSAVRESLRKPLFYTALIVSWVMAIMIMMIPALQHQMAMIAMGFMIMVNGIFIAFYMIAAGLRLTNPGARIKAIGGGVGVASCCLASHVLFGTEITSLVMLSFLFQFGAPIIMLASGWGVRRLQQAAPTPTPAV